MRRALRDPSRPACRRQTFWSQIPVELRAVLMVPLPRPSNTSSQHDALLRCAHPLASTRRRGVHQCSGMWHRRQIMLADDQRTAIVKHPQLGGGTDPVFPAQQMELRDEARTLIDGASIRPSIWHAHREVADKSR